MTLVSPKISIGIRTFLRDEKLLRTIAAIRAQMPTVTMIIADCGEDNPLKQEVYNQITQERHQVIHLPFDAGFGAMSNAIVENLDTPYLLIGSDDFDFNPPYVRDGIKMLSDTLDFELDLDIVSGRVRGPYEFNLEDEGGTVTERRVPSTGKEWFVPCDLTVNYSLIRRHVFDNVRWDSDVKIGGGEHGAFFVDVKRSGYAVAYVPGVAIGEQMGVDSPEYQDFRRRAASPLRPCFDRRGITKYILGNGRVDYEKPEYGESITR